MNESVHNLVTVTPPGEEPVPLTLAKKHCRVTFTNDDDLIAVLVQAARENCEKEIRRAFVTRTYELRLNRFPLTLPMGYLSYYSMEQRPNQTYGVIRLPKPPLISVTSITYVDNSGSTITLDPSLYQVDAGGVLQGTVAPAYGLTWPQCRVVLDSVRITYQAGYGAAADVPASIVQAMLLAIGHWYSHREAASELNLTEIPMGSRALLSSFRWGSYG